MWGVDGDKTVGISDTVRVTADGCESFFTLDEDFACKPGHAAATEPEALTLVEDTIEEETA